MKKILLAMLLLVSATVQAGVSYDDCMYLADIGYTAATLKDEGRSEKYVMDMFLSDPKGEWAPNPALRETTRMIIVDVYNEQQLEGVTGKQMNLMVYAKCNW